MYLSPLHVRVTGKYPGARGRSFAAASLVAAGAVLALLLSSCSTSATYAGSASQDVYFKLPRSWTVYNQTTLQNMGLVNATQTSQAQASGNSYQLSVTFASPNPHLGAHGGPDFSGSSPWAYNFVESLGGSDAGVALIGRAPGPGAADRYLDPAGRSQAVGADQAAGGRRPSGERGLLTKPKARAGR